MTTTVHDMLLQRGLVLAAPPGSPTDTLAHAIAETVAIGMHGAPFTAVISPMAPVLPAVMA